LYDVLERGKISSAIRIARKKRLLNGRKSLGRLAIAGLGGFYEIAGMKITSRNFREKNPFSAFLFQVSR
jgi:hypothetical protein